MNSLKKIRHFLVYLCSGMERVDQTIPMTVSRLRHVHVKALFSQAGQREESVLRAGKRLFN